MNDMNDLNRLYSAKMEHHKTAMRRSEQLRASRRNADQLGNLTNLYSVFNNAKRGWMAACLATILVMIWFVV